MPKLDIEQCLGCGSFVPFVLDTTGLYVALCWWCGCTMTQVHGVRQPSKLKAVPAATPNLAGGHPTPAQPVPDGAKTPRRLGGQPPAPAARRTAYTAPEATAWHGHA